MDTPPPLPLAPGDYAIARPDAPPEGRLRSTVLQLLSLGVFLGGGGYLLKGDVGLFVGGVLAVLATWSHESLRRRDGHYTAYEVHDDGIVFTQAAPGGAFPAKIPFSCLRDVKQADGDPTSIAVTFIDPDSLNPTAIKARERVRRWAVRLGAPSTYQTPPFQTRTLTMDGRAALLNGPSLIAQLDILKRIAAASAAAASASGAAPDKS